MSDGVAPPEEYLKEVIARLSVMDWVVRQMLQTQCIGLNTPDKVGEMRKFKEMTVRKFKYEMTTIGTAETADFDMDIQRRSIAYAEKWLGEAVDGVNESLMALLPPGMRPK